MASFNISKIGYCRYEFKPITVNGESKIVVPTNWKVPEDVENGRLVKFTFTYEWVKSSKGIENGRCNITNVRWWPGYYNSKQTFVPTALVSSGFKKETSSYLTIKFGKNATTLREGCNIYANIENGHRPLNALRYVDNVNASYITASFVYKYTDSTTYPNASPIIYSVEINNIKIPKPSKYENNVVFTEAGVNELLDNIKKYPVTSVSGTKHTSEVNPYTLKVTKNGTTTEYTTGSRVALPYHEKIASGNKYSVQTYRSVKDGDNFIKMSYDNWQDVWRFGHAYVRINDRDYNLKIRGLSYSTKDRFKVSTRLSPYVNNYYNIGYGFYEIKNASELVEGNRYYTKNDGIYNVIKVTNTTDQAAGWNNEYRPSVNYLINNYFNATTGKPKSGKTIYTHEKWNVVYGTQFGTSTSPASYVMTEYVGSKNYMPERVYAQRVGYPYITYVKNSEGKDVAVALPQYPMDDPIPDNDYRVQYVNARFLGAPKSHVQRLYADDIGSSAHHVTNAYIDNLRVNNVSGLEIAIETEYAYYPNQSNRPTKPSGDIKESTSTTTWHTTLDSKDGWMSQRVNKGNWSAAIRIKAKTIIENIYYPDQLNPPSVPSGSVTTATSTDTWHTTRNNKDGWMSHRINGGSWLAPSRISAQTLQFAYHAEVTNSTTGVTSRPTKPSSAVSNPAPPGWHTEIQDTDVWQSQRSYENGAWTAWTEPTALNRTIQSLLTNLDRARKGDFGMFWEDKKLTIIADQIAANAAGVTELLYLAKNATITFQLTDETRCSMGFMMGFGTGNSELEYRAGVGLVIYNCTQAATNDDNFRGEYYRVNAQLLLVPTGIAMLTINQNANWDNTEAASIDTTPYHYQRRYFATGDADIQYVPKQLFYHPSNGYLYYRTTDTRQLVKWTNGNNLSTNPT